MDLTNCIEGALRRIVRRLLGVDSARLAVVFLTAAVMVSVMIVLTIDFLWDGRFNLELEFAGVITPFLDGLFILVFFIAMLDELRAEVGGRKKAEEEVRLLNIDLEQRVAERTRQLREANEELVRREKLAVLGQVAGSVGHELRNPLGVMSNAVYYLENVLIDTDEITREYLGMIKNEIAEADRIVGDLLDSVRTKPPQPQPATIRELIAMAMQRCVVPEKVEVRLEIPEMLSRVEVDPLQMQQVFRNLIVNAFDAMPEGGVLEIGARDDMEKQTIAVMVRDSGVGMSEEQRTRLFQPLFTTKARGIGLGLVVVKNLTAANGGTVVVESEPGQGTIFTVTLPCGEGRGDRPVARTA